MHEFPVAAVTNDHKLEVKVKVAQSCLTLCDPRSYTVPGILQARILEWEAFLFSRGSSPTQGSNPGLPTLQVDSLPAEPPGKPKNTGVCGQRAGAGHPGGFRAGDPAAAGRVILLSVQDAAGEPRPHGLRIL